MVEAPVTEPDSKPVASGGDPWEDEKWTQYKWTVYRGQAYDLTPYLARHPGGRWLLNLAIGRDCTALFESSHLRPEVATQAFNRLPKLEGFPVEAVPRSPYPNDSELYNAIRCVRRKGGCVSVCRGAGKLGWRAGKLGWLAAGGQPASPLQRSAESAPSRRAQRPAGRSGLPSPPAHPPACLSPPLRDRVRKEIFKGEEAKGAHRSGSEGAALAVLGYTALTYSLYITNTNPITGECAGWAGWSLQAPLPPAEERASARSSGPRQLEAGRTWRLEEAACRCAHAPCPALPRARQARCWAWPAPGSG
jgi:hypothetical protein